MSSLPRVPRRNARPRRGMLVVNGALLAVFAFAVALFVPMPDSRRIGFMLLAGLAAALTGAAAVLLPRAPSAQRSRAERRRLRRR